MKIAEIDATNEDAPQVEKTYLWDPSEPVANRIAGHGLRGHWGWRSGMPSSSKGEENGFVNNEFEFSDNVGQSITDISDLKWYMGRKEIVFCKHGTISIFACRIDKGLIQALAAQTKCRVTGSGGACRRRVGGAGWETNADMKGDSGEFWTSDAGGEPYPSGKYHIPVLFNNK